MSQQSGGKLQSAWKYVKDVYKLLNKAGSEGGVGEPSETIFHVVTLIVKSIFTEKTTVKDLTMAEERVRGLRFDKFEETFNSQVMEGIKLKDFEEIVDRIAKRHSIPEEKKDGILDGKCAKKNTLVAKEFVFNVGEDSQLVYMKVATVKTSDTKIDLALMYYKLDFKLAPLQTETTRSTWFLSMKIGEKTEIEYKTRDLSEKDQDCFTNFFRYKALKGFLQENPGARNQIPQGLYENKFSQGL